MNIVDRTSLTFWRMLFFILGIIFGYFVIAAFLILVTEHTGPEILLIGPLALIVSATIYLVTLVIMGTKKATSNRSFVRRSGLFLGICVACSILFLALSQQLYLVPIFRLNNTSISIFEAPFLERKLGFKPLLPSEVFANYQPSWKEVTNGTLVLHFSNDLHEFSYTQTNNKEMNTFILCNNIRNGQKENFASKPITIANQNTTIYYPTEQNEGVVKIACIPLPDRYLSVSIDDDNKVATMERIIPWLQKMK